MCRSVRNGQNRITYRSHGPMIEYLKFRRERFELSRLGNCPQWDVLISAYNNSDRVRRVFEAAPARSKYWFMANEYRYERREAPTGSPVVWLPEGNESDAIVQGLTQTGVDFAKERLCVDITGFMRPHILFLTKYLSRVGVWRFDVIYSEPVQYTKKEATQFSIGDPYEVRQVSGFEGIHSTDVSTDLLVIGAGYDDQLVARVAGHKERSRVVFLYGFPSLSADMYQQSVLRMSKPIDAVEGRLLGGDGAAFASANDPFVTAAVLCEVCDEAKRRDNVTNLYLTPLGTKPQTLGFGIAYLRHFEGTPASIVFPFSHEYARETSTGIGRVWTYQVELQ
jgi:hypothetical protein